MQKSQQKNQQTLFAFLGLSLGALGVVYGDIGTSPLYAINEIFFGHGHTAVTIFNVYGAISLVVWALTLVITLKYILFVLRADFEGEGGVFALFSILRESKAKRAVITGILILAAGMLFGDGIITPSISVLSAVEGLKFINPAFETFIIPITIGILTLLFLFQSKGTHKIGRIFGPIMSIWFLVIAWLGLSQIIQHPQILYALNPWLALHFMISIGIAHTMVLLGSVVLVVTGGEALYADIGHFGAKPVRFSWLVLVYPALLLNYLGQGAFLLGGTTVTNIFFGMVPKLYLYPSLLLATLATIIASQALITGVFSLASQGINIGLIPRLRIKHTNAKQEGQIYIGAVNWILYVCCVELVLVFKSSAGLAASYGLAVSGVMLATSLAMIPIMIEKWHWARWKVYILFGVFVFIDSVFLFSNSLKFFEGGYVPVFFGLATFFIMNTWLWGRTLVWNVHTQYTEHRTIAWLSDLKKRLVESGGYLKDGKHSRILVESDRVIVFMVSDIITKNEDKIPVSLRIYMKRTGSLPKYIILLNINYKKIPYISAHDRFTVNDFGDEICAVQANFGFMEQPDVRQVLRELNPNIAPDLEKSIIVVDREQFFIDKNASLLLKIKAKIFRVTLMFGVRAKKYFGLHSRDGLFEVEVPIHIDKHGANIRHPEFDLSYPESKN